MKKVQPGQQLEIPASTFNAFIDAAQAHQQRQLDALGCDRAAASQPGVILVKNTATVNVARFGVLALDGPVISPTDNADEFKRQVAMKGKAPATGDFDNFVITMEPIAQDKIGRAMAIGVTPVIVEVTTDTADCIFAAPKADETGKLALSGAGLARVLWREDGTGDKLALIRMSGMDAQVFGVLMSQDGGDDGSKTARASWTYTITTLGGATLATTVSPIATPHLCRRPAYGKVIQATFGMAYYDSSGTLVLAMCNEKSQTGPC